VTWPSPVATAVATGTTGQVGHAWVTWGYPVCTGQVGQSWVALIETGGQVGHGVITAKVAAGQVGQGLLTVTV